MSPCPIQKTISCDLYCCDYINVQFLPYDNGLGDCCWTAEITKDESICDFTGKTIGVNVYDGGVLKTPNPPKNEYCFGSSQSTDITYKITIDGAECTERETTLTCDDCSLISIVVDDPTVGDECCHEFTVNVDPSLAKIHRNIKIFKASELPENDIDKVDSRNPHIVFQSVVNWMKKGKICHYSAVGADYIAVIYDRDRNILCEKLFSIPGCSCECPQDLNNILDVDMYNGPGSDCEDQQCRVNISLKDKVDLSCFDKFEMAQVFTGTGLGGIVTPLTDLVNFDATFEGGICIVSGEEITIELKLYQDGNPVPCVVTKTYTCDLRSVDINADELCKPVCPENDWTGPEPDDKSIPWDLEYPIPGYPNCYIKMKYFHREACDGYQDIQIIEYTLVSKDGCNQSFTDSEVYTMTVAAIAARNQMGFEPVLAGIDEFNKNCNSFWRATQSSCWIEWMVFTDNIGYGNADGSQTVPEGPSIKIHIKREACQADCCMRKFEVCRWKEGGEEKVSITDLGMMGTADDCTTIITDDMFPGAGIPRPCEYTCDLLAEISSTITTFKQSIESDDDFIDPDAMFVELNVVQFGESLNISVNNTNADKMRVFIIDMNGKVLLDADYELGGGSDLQFSLDMSELITGSYIYSIEVDGKFLKSDNVLIVK